MRDSTRDLLHSATLAAIVMILAVLLNDFAVRQSLSPAETQAFEVLLYLLAGVAIVFAGNAAISCLTVSTSENPEENLQAQTEVTER